MSVRFRSRRAVCLALLTMPWLAACGKRKPAVSALPVGSTVLALGDSLTAGVGAHHGEDWPSLLAERTGWEVINAGVSGDTSAQGLARLPALLQEYAPQLVVIGLGGNDFLRRQSSANTREHLRLIVQAVQASGAQVVVLGIPQLSLMVVAGKPSDHPLYAELGDEMKVPVLGGLWGPILGDASLRAD